MSHNLDMSNDRVNMAFLGSRKDIWHGLGQQMAKGMSIAEWGTAAGLEWQAVKVPALAALPHQIVEVPGRYHIARNDTWALLNEQTVTDIYQPHQPKELMAWFERYVSVDDRFTLDVAGSLRGGQIIWATATFRPGLEVAGSKHVARLLMSTTYDASGPTINKATTVRVVCNNTFDAAMASKKGEVRTRHNTKFDHARVGRELANVAQSFAEYKAMGEALAGVEMTKTEVSNYFKQLLEIPFDAKAEDVSSRKLNTFHAMGNAYRAEVEAGTEAGKAWTAFNAVTRFVDHDRSVRIGEQVKELEAKALSSQFGSGAALKGQAWNLLMPRIKDKVAV